MKPIITWIVTADGGRMRIFENRGPGKGLHPVPGMAVEEDHLRAQDIVSDRPGRTSSSAGYGRSAIQPHTDPVAHEEENFARRVAGVLEAKWDDGAFNRLIIAAEPTALGNIRHALRANVNEAVVAELQRDLTNVPLTAMPAHFDKLLAL